MVAAFILFYLDCSFMDFGHYIMHGHSARSHACGVLNFCLMVYIVSGLYILLYIDSGVWT